MADYYFCLNQRYHGLHATRRDLDWAFAIDAPLAREEGFAICKLHLHLAVGNSLCISRNGDRHRYRV